MRIEWEPMTYSNSIGILGAGNWGTVLACLAAENAQRVYLYDRDPKRAQEMMLHRENKRYLPGIKIPESISITTSLGEVFDHCLLVLPVVPSYAMRGFCSQFSTHVRGDHFIVHGTKGFEPKSHKRMSQVIQEETGCLRVGALSGPNLASELARGQCGASIIASSFEEVIQATQLALSSKRFRILGRMDLIGVEWIGALKNILALSSGICAEQAVGQNATAMVMSQLLEEVAQLMTSMGADLKTVISLAGFGDIIATSTSPLSRNFRAGQQLAQGKAVAAIEEDLAMTVEGFNTLKAAQEMALEKGLDLQVIHALWSLAFDSRHQDQKTSQLLTQFFDKVMNCTEV